LGHAATNILATLPLTISKSAPEPAA